MTKAVKQPYITALSNTYRHIIHKIQTHITRKVSTYKGEKQILSTTERERERERERKRVNDGNNGGIYV